MSASTPNIDAAFALDDSCHPWHSEIGDAFYKARHEIRALIAEAQTLRELVADLAEWLPQRCDVEAAEDVEALADVKRRLAALEAL